MKKLLGVILALCVLLTGSAALAEAGDYIGDMEVVRCNEYVSMRAEPDTDSERILKVSLGSVVEDCVVYNDEFIYGEFDMNYGYILSDYLEPCEGVKTFDSMQVVNCDEYVPLFSQPDTDSDRLTKIPLDAWVENCVVYDDVFTYAEYDGWCGFVLSEYLSEGRADLTGWEYFGQTRVFKCDSWVSLYAEPDTDSDRLTKIPLGEVVENCYIGPGDFIYGEYDGYAGYILGRYLIGNEYIAYDEINYAQVGNCESWVALREEATTASERLMKAPKDLIVEVIGEQADYYHVLCDGLEGFIHSRYLLWQDTCYADSDDQLMNSRIQLNYDGAAFGTYLISYWMGGEWSVIEEMHHLEAVLNGLPEEWHPVAMTIPEERIIEIIGGMELYLIIPADEDMSVTVNRLQLGYDGFTGIVDEVLYESETGEPFLLRCNEFEVALDCEIILEDGAGGRTVWYPCMDWDTGRVYTGAEGGICLDFTVYEEE